MRFMTGKAVACAIAIALVIITSPVPAASSMTNEEMEKKIQALEEKIEELEANSEINSAIGDDLETRLDNLVRISGYLAVEYIATDKKMMSAGSGFIICRSFSTGT